MENAEKPIEKILHELRERAKELDCLYRAEEILQTPTRPPDEVCPRLLEILPPGFQYPKLTRARIRIRDLLFVSDDFMETPWGIEARILVQDEPVGSLQIFYTEALPEETEGPFLREERRLINSIADLRAKLLQSAVSRVVENPSGGPSVDAWRAVAHSAEAMLLVAQYMLTGASCAGLGS